MLTVMALFTTLLLAFVAATAPAPTPTPSPTPTPEPRRAPVVTRAPIATPLPRPTAVPRKSVQPLPRRTAHPTPAPTAAPSTATPVPLEPARVHRFNDPRIDYDPGRTAQFFETGSTQLYPLFNVWAPAFSQIYPQIQFATQGTGSGVGIADVMSGTAQIGASDAFMTDEQIAESPMLNVPLAISAEIVTYNVPGLNTVHLNLSGAVLAGIYAGHIQYWDDSAIKTINKDAASKLPHAKIVPIHRADGSADNLIFTKYLAASLPSWNSSPGSGTVVRWPLPASAIGNAGMLQACENTPYSITYNGIAYQSQSNAVPLGEAALANYEGRFLLPSISTITAAATSGAMPQDQRASLVFVPGVNSYPMANYEYAIVNPNLRDDAQAYGVRVFLAWAVTDGQAPQFMNAMNWAPLPLSIQTQTLSRIATIP
jgi:phosphate transport system substrate-binding protein